PGKSRKMHPQKLKWFSAGIGKPSVWHAVIFTFLHSFCWGLLTVPFIIKLSETFGDRAFFVEGLVLGVRGILAFLTTPLLGSFSDIQGRKVVLLLAVVITYSPIPSMMIEGWWYFGILTVTGVFESSYFVSQAYVADVTTPQERSKSYGILEATDGAGNALSPLLGNFLLDALGTTFVLKFSIITGAVNILFIIFVVPESLPQRDEEENPEKCSVKIEEKNGNIKEINANKIEEKVHTYNAKEKKEILRQNGTSQSLLLENISRSNMKATIDEVLKLNSPNTRDLLKFLQMDKSLLAIYMIGFLGMWPFAGVHSCLPTYLKLNMGFSYREVSLLVGLVAIICVTTNLLLAPTMRMLGAKWSIRLGLLLMLLELLVFGYGSSHWSLWLASILSSTSTIIHPLCSTVASLYAGSENHGSVLGVLSAIDSLCDGLGPAVFGVLFYFYRGTSKYPPQEGAMSPIPVPFLVAAFGVLVALGLTNFLRKET
ncbi:hypothetical protein KR018_002607, partial [Drosophila ironensis]